jgi:type IV secretion system protein VirB10
LLANAPKTYGEVPKLGPPLPGDLGKPILDQQRAAVAVSVAGAPSPSQRIRLWLPSVSVAVRR